MSKTRSTFVCQSCGAATNRWQGKCDACGAWNSIVEEQAATGIGAGTARKAAPKGRQIAFQSLAATGRSRRARRSASPSSTASRAAASCRAR